MQERGERVTRRYLWASTREMTLIILFSSLWIAAEMFLGPMIGPFSIGPFSLHGSVNRLVGWLLMVVLAEGTGRFGRVTAMTCIATLATRVIRSSALEGTIVGLGYALGGLVFDVLYFLPIKKSLNGKLKFVYSYFMYVVSGIFAIVPYLLFKLIILGLYTFMALSPSFGWSVFKGIILSIVGASLGVSLSYKLKPLWRLEGEVELEHEKKAK
ncbi:MAG: hypothetical protein QG670_1835 [Thermoproteota archaeon]|nr:hypothetical protein [Thermoproteota archaeon]